ncbi:hypothetical protein PsYK624_114740 [Phanerochaete sordida]|uniref:BTB domain-containing protein n=1 Tax=Phanerochaete sordida TaxID=48140 RepID=A0A9P3LH88_9APHY|nr:hypothetical protein PsYK624_114740 [Phanerochaete sordida]
MPFANIVHDDKLYLADGDLAICSAAADDGTTTVFRVHKAVMAHNSPVFRGMFGLPAAPAAQDCYDGASLVRVTDTAEELRALLDALYNPGALNVTRWDPDAPLALTPAMRLAKKYEVDALAQRIAALLTESWPQTLKQWLRSHAEYTVLAHVCASYDPLLTDGAQLWAQVPEPGAAVRFARAFDVPALLPFAYYTLARTRVGVDWAQFAAAPDEHVARPVRWGALSPEDFVRVMHGREVLGTEVAALQAWAAPASLRALLQPLRCVRANRAECSKHIVALSEMLQAAFTDTNSVQCPDPLGALEKMHGDRDHWPVCPRCAETLETEIRNRQAMLWCGLRKTFQLP